MSCGCKARTRRVLVALWEKIPYGFIDLNERMLQHIREQKASAVTRELPLLKRVPGGTIVAAEKRSRFAFTRKRNREVLK